jgi:WD40 repeat protein
MKSLDCGRQRQIPCRIGNIQIGSVAIPPDGRYKASGSYDRTIKMWNTCKETELNTLTGRSAAVHLDIFSLESKLLVLVPIGYTIKLWDTAKGTILHSGVAGRGGLG